MLKLYLADGWEKLRQKGSHVRIKKGSIYESIPMHKELKKGTEEKLLKILKDNR